MALDTSKKGSYKKESKSQTEGVDDADIPRILVMDDDREVRHLLAKSLRDQGYDVLEAKDRDDVVGRLNLNVSNPRSLYGLDLTILDVPRAGVDGLGLLERIRESSWSTDVVIISAFADDDMVEEAMRLGAAAVVAKPIALDDFILTINEIISNK